MAITQENPYVGPRTFTRAERNRFFGREQEARDLVSLVMSERLVLFFAQSGAGKSSLINARLIPWLVEQEGFIALPIGRVSGTLPPGVEQVDNIFLFNLMLSLDQSQREPARFAHMSLPHFLAHLATNDGEYYEYQEPAADNETVETANDDIPPHILVIDQFEEILTTHLSRWRERDEFFRQLNEAMREDPLLWVVLTLREDHVAALRPYARLMDNNMRTRFYMKRMEAPAARQAIENPARQAGCPFAPGVADILVENLRQIKVQGQETTEPGQFVEPVQLQVVCYQLWQNLQDRDVTSITEEALQELGDVDTALAQFYEQAISQVLQDCQLRQETQVSEIDLRTWFDRQLITPAETRGIVYQGKETTAGLNNNVVRLLADQFLVRAENRAGGTWYELVHDRFIPPILKANQAWRIRQSPLVQAAEAWDSSGRRRELLYKDEQLKGVLATIDRQEQPPLVQIFLEHSEEAQRARDADAARAMAEEQRQRAEVATRLAEAEQQRAEVAMRLAETEKQRAQAETRNAHRLRRLTRWLGVALALAAVFAFFFVLAYIGANTNANLAATREAEAEVARATSDANANLAATRASEAQAARATSDINAVLAATREAEAQIARATSDANAALAADNANRALANAESARIERDRAIQSEQRAREARAEAERLRQISLAQSLAAQAFRIITRSNDNQLAALLSIEALRISEEAGGNALGLIDNSLRESLSQSYFSTVVHNSDGEIWATALSPDQKTVAFFALSTHKQEIRLLDLTAPTRPAVVLAGSGLPGVDRLVFSHDGQTLAAVTGWDVYLWDLSAPEADPTILYGDSTGERRIIDLVFRTDGRTLLTADDSGAIHTWNLDNVRAGGRNGVSSVTPAEITRRIQANEFVALRPDGAMLVTSIGNRINLWAVTSRVSLDLFLAGSNEPAIMAVFSPDYRYLATAHTNGSIRVWDINSFRTGANRFVQLTSGGEPVTAMRFSPDGQRLLTAYTDGIIHLWNRVNAVTQPLVLRGHRSQVFFAAFAPDNHTLISTGFDNIIRSWNLELTSIDTVLRQGDPLAFNTSITLSPDGQTLAVANEGTIELWNLNTPSAQPRALALPGNDPVATLAFSADGRRLAAGSRENQTIYLWDLTQATRDPVMLQTPLANIAAVALSPDGQRVAAVYWSEFVVHIWNWEALEQLPDELQLPGTVLLPGISAVAFNHTGTTLAAADASNSVILWYLDQPEAAPVHLVDGNQETLIWASGVSFSHDDQLVIVGGYDGRLSIWDLAHPEAPLASLNLGTTYQFVTADFSPDDQLVAVSGETSVYVWNMADLRAGQAGQPIQLSGHNVLLRQVIFRPDGQVISASADGAVHAWVARLDTLVTMACELAWRNLTWDEWQLYLGNDTYQPSCPNRPVPLSVINALVAAEQIDKALSLAAPAEVAHALINLANTAIQQANLETAQQAIQQARELDAMIDTTPLAQTLLDEINKDESRYAQQPEIVVAAVALANELDPTLALVPEEVLTAVTINRVYALVSRGQVDEALATARRANEQYQLELEPENLVVEGLLYDLQVASPLYSRQPERALAALDQALTLNPMLAVNDPLTVAGAYHVICQQIQPEMAGETDFVATELVSVLLPACQRAAELAGLAQSPYLDYQICLYQHNAALNGLVNVGDACERAATAGRDITIGQSVTGTVQPASGDLWRFSGSAGQVVTIRMEKENDELDPLMLLYGPDNSYLIEDDDSGGNWNALIQDFVLPATGTYTIVTCGWSNTAGDYRLTLSIGR